VPFFLVGGTALGVGRGDSIEPLDDTPPRSVVLVFPPFGVSTPEAFGWWDEDNPAVDLRRADVGGAPERRAPTVDRRGECANDLEGPVFRRHPELIEIRHVLERADAEEAAMSGSGSTLFGLFVDEAKAWSAVESLDRSGWKAAMTRTATRRESALF
jgi:4-diphosphocytidyl-2-C-methyl-D-erythritol kinase